MLPDFKKYKTPLLAAALVAALVGLAAAFHKDSVQISKLSSKETELQETLSKTLEKNSELTQEITKLKTIDTESNRDVVVKTYDPVTGKLTQSKHIKSATTKHEQDSSQERTHKTDTEKESVEKTKTEKSKQTDSVTITPVDTRSGFAVGGFVSAAGPGVSVDYAIVSLNNKIHVDASAAVVVKNGKPDPKLGIAVAGEIMPRLSAGVGVYLTLEGDPLGYYYPLVPVGVAPGVTLQYRF